MVPQQFVVVVDDDDSVREALPELLRTMGYAAMAYASAEEYLSSSHVNETRCLFLDVALPGMCGPELQQELIRRGHQIPIIFMTAAGDPNLPPKLIGLGAVACLLKPFSEQNLREALANALT